MGTVIQQRDLILLKALYATRVLTIAQVHKYYFAGRHESAVRRRLTKLYKSGFIDKGVVSIRQRMQKCILLKEKSWPLICESWGFEVDQPHFKTESPEHDIRLVDIVFKFRRLKSFNKFISENLLQSSSFTTQQESLRDLSRIQADGALLLKDQRGVIRVFGVELEISRKSPERYVEKLQAYYSSHSIDGLIYIGANTEILDTVARSDEVVRKGPDSILHLGLEADVLKSSNKMYFRNALKHGIELL